MYSWQFYASLYLNKPIFSFYFIFKEILFLLSQKVRGKLNLRPQCQNHITVITPLEVLFGILNEVKIFVWLLFLFSQTMEMCITMEWGFQGIWSLDLVLQMIQNIWVFDFSYGAMLHYEWLEEDDSGNGSRKQDFFMVFFQQKQKLCIRFVCLP